MRHVHHAASDSPARYDDWVRASPEHEIALLLKEQDELNVRLFARGMTLAPARIVPPVGARVETVLACLRARVATLAAALGKGEPDDDAGEASRIRWHERRDAAGLTLAASVAATVLQRGVDAPDGWTLGSFGLGGAAALGLASAWPGVSALALAPMLLAVPAALFASRLAGTPVQLDAKHVTMGPVRLGLDRVGYFEILCGLDGDDGVRGEPLVVAHPPELWPESVLAGHGKPPLVVSSPVAHGLVRRLNAALRELRRHATPYRD